MMNSVDPRVKGLARPSTSKIPPPPRRIPFAFRADPVGLDGLKLPRTARAVFTLVLDNARSRGGRCRLSNATMGGILGCCAMTIKRSLAALESAGLVRREMVAGGRVRAGIVVTWEGVEHSGATGRTELERSRSAGGTLPDRGVEQSGSTNHPGPIRGETSDAGRSPLGGEEDAASQVASGPEAAAYLRACVAAGKRGEPMPPPPSANPPAVSSPLAVPPPADRTAAAGKPIPPGVALADIGRMVRSLSDDLKAPDVGRRRPSAARLARMLGEARRKRAGKAQPRGGGGRSMTDVGGALSG